MQQDQMNKFIEKIQAAADDAQNIIDYSAAHDEEIRYAIDIVEAFLRRTHRICYGGQAINTYLPEKYRFYDPLKSIPDYDFLTPTGAQDIKQLVASFKEAGFTDIGVRPGMHKGTMKVYINYTAVADVTEINPDFYMKLYERSRNINGIQYMDANTLRMMMYLELSRPMGEVGRWEKVFTRLELLNMYAPLKCKKKRTQSAAAGKAAAAAANKIKDEERKHVLDFVIYEQRVLVGADIVSFYRQRLKKKNIDIDWFIGRKEPVLFYSPNVDEDTFVLKKQLEKYGRKIAVDVIEAEAEFFPKVVLLRTANDSDIVCGLIQETACHAYNTVELSSQKQLRIGSFDTLITLYLSMTFQKKLDAAFDESILCMAQQVIELQKLHRNMKRPTVPFISIQCSGHQKQLSSLLREKVERIRAAKGVGSLTRRGSRSSRSSRSSRGSRATRSTPRSTLKVK
jgi:hypothetical protein